APLVAVVCRRLGERLTSLLGAGLVAGGCLLSTQATSVPFLCISMGLLLGELGTASPGQAEQKQLLQCPSAVNHPQQPLHPVLQRSFPTPPPFPHQKEIFSLPPGTLLIFGGIMLNLVPSSMLLRPASTQPPARPAPGPSVAEKDPESLDGCLDKASHRETQLHSAQDPPSTEGLLLCQGRDATSLAGRLEAAPTESSAAETSTKAQGSSKALPAAGKAKSQPLLDLSPLKDPLFGIFTWSFFFSHLAYFVPFFHLVARARTLGISSMDASYLIAVAGITETLSQLLSGWIADQNWTKKYHYHVAYLVLSGITNLLCPLATTFPLLMTYVVACAVFCGGFMALVLPGLVDLVGVQKLHSYLGFAAFFAGFAAIGGPPLAG
ncbi:MOT5 protein, partial [Ramphastos sulfuratus]|nr:MOT5 protein [Ramphastos sulfuratus]